MGAQPKRKIGNVQQQVRRAAKKLELQQLGKCEHCNAPVRSHRMCTNCGYYKGRPVISMEHNH